MSPDVKSTHKISPRYLRQTEYLRDVRYERREFENW